MPGVVLPPGVNSEITKAIIANLKIYKYAMRMHLAAPPALAWAVTYISDLLTCSEG